MKRRLALLTAATVVVAGGVALAIAPAGAAAAGCQVDYSVTSQWSGGFTAAVHVTNLGSPLSGWTLGFDFSAGQKVTQGLVADRHPGDRDEPRVERVAGHERVDRPRIQRIRHRIEPDTGGVHSQRGDLQRHGDEPKPKPVPVSVADLDHGEPAAG